MCLLEKDLIKKFSDVSVFTGTRSKMIFLSDLENDQELFWKRIGKTGTGMDRKKSIPMQVVLEDV